jgi:HEAT repeat protein
MRRPSIVPALLIALVPAAASAQPAAFEDVVRNLRNPDAKIRLGAVRMLHEAQHVEAAGPVAAVVNDPLDNIQLEAIAAELSFFLVRDVPTRRHVALIVEVRSEGQAADAFEQGPLASWPRPVPPEVVDALLRAVDDENARVRTEAIYAAGVIARPPVSDTQADQLIKALDHYDPSIRAAAARVIGRLQVKRAGDALIKAVNDSTSAVRFASMRALGEIHEERAIQALGEQLAYYKKGEGAWSALDALARIGHSTSVPIFKSYLSDKDPWLRRAAAEGLGRSGDTSEIARMQEAANTDASPAVRAALSFGLLKSGQNYLPRLTEYLKSDRTAPQVQGYLLEIGPSVAPTLTPALQDPDPEVRSGVAEVLGAIGTPEIVAALDPVTKDRDRRVAETAAAAIERIKMRH